MKKILFSLLFPLLSLISCKKIAELTQFEMEYNESIVIPAVSGINLPLNVFTPDTKSNSTSTFESNETRKDLIEEIKLKKLDFTLTSPSNGDFSFLKSIEIFINADGLSETKIAGKTSISSEIGNYLELDLVDVDLKEFIKKEEYSLRIETVTDEAINSDHHIDIHTKFFVDAKILGQ